MSENKWVVLGYDPYKWSYKMNLGKGALLLIPKLEFSEEFSEGFPYLNDNLSRFNVNFSLEWQTFCINQNTWYES